ncbi:MAG: hypothetical protein U5J63_05295 [Fodinibius sp.]|nr:hypothetical protein [Fodinibius sp.]
MICRSDFSADSATYKDTVEADLSDLPGEGDNSKTSGARLTLQYTNALPLELGLDITMLDANGQSLIKKNNISIEGAGVDDDGFVNQPAESELEISFSEEELK